MPKQWKQTALPAALGIGKALIKWLVLASVVGVLVGAVGSVFAHTLGFANDLRAQQPLIVLALPVSGLLIVFLYRIFHNTDDRGTNMVIASIQSSAGIPGKMAPLIFVSTVMTHLCGGSAGREGAALQLGGSIANQLGKLLRFNEDDRHLVVMCGMSAGFSALFGTPMAAAIFSMEVVSVGVMQYAALVPCVTAALMAGFVARFFRVPPEVFPVAELPVLTPSLFFRTAGLAVLVGVVSILFCLVLHGAEHAYKKLMKNHYLRITAAGCLVAGLALLLGTDRYLGSGMGIIEGLFHHGDLRWYDFLLKILFTALTLGAGFKGGEIVPSFAIGAAFGALMAAFLGLPLPLAAACGMTGLFCGVTNSPLTALLISFELFGLEGMPNYLITVAVSYLVSGYTGLYHAQKILYSKTDSHFIDTNAR